MKILVVYYSLHGHVWALAQAVAEGVRSVAGVEADLRRVPETLPPDVLEKMRALEISEKQASIPICTLDELGEADGIIFGTPTRFGNMCGQMRQFLDATGRLWARGALIGKVGSVFTSSDTQHGGQETTLTSFHTTLLHHGMLIAGLPYSFKGQSETSRITGCSPYGASTIASLQGSPHEIELAGAHFQGAYVAEIVKKLRASPQA